MEIDDLIAAAMDRLMVNEDTAAMVVARDIETCRDVTDRKSALVRACGNCGKNHDYHTATIESACDHLRALWDAEAALSLAENNAPMGVLPCVRCGGSGVYPNEARCSRCVGRGWFYREGDRRATAAEERIEHAPPPKPDEPPRRRQPAPGIIRVPKANSKANFSIAQERQPRRWQVWCVNCYANRTATGERAIVNKHPGKCWDCKAQVPEGKGYVTLIKKEKTT